MFDRAKYIKYIVNNGINVRKNQKVEIRCSTKILDFANELKAECLNMGSGCVYINCYDSKEEQDKIHDGYSKYINAKVEYYNDLKNDGFCLIYLLSPFIPNPCFNTLKIEEYNECRKKLKFLIDYFYSFESQYCICAVPNYYWAQVLKIPYDLLCEKIYNLAENTYLVEEFKEYLNNLDINELLFNDGCNIDLRVKLTNNFKFNGPICFTKQGIEFQPNIPSKEIYTAPYKYGINGKLVSDKFYQKLNGNLFCEIEFLNGKIINQKNLDDILNNDDLYYCGEIALVEYVDDFFSNTFLDENLSCHIALGGAYKHGLSEYELTNHSPIHIDIPFGTKMMDVIARCNDGKDIYIMRKGLFVFKDK